MSLENIETLFVFILKMFLKIVTDVNLIEKNKQRGKRHIWRCDTLTGEYVISRLRTIHPRFLAKFCS